MKPCIVLAAGVVAVALAACSTHESRKDFPVAGEVRQAFGDVMAMAGDSSERRDLESKHETWLASRSGHCTALGKAEGAGQEAALTACFAALDQERVRALRHVKLSQLVRQPAVNAGIEPEPGLRLPLDSRNPPMSLAVSRDGRLAAVGSHTGTVEVFDLASRLKLRSLQAEKYAAHLWFTANGRVLITGSRQVRGMKVWDVHKGELLHEHDGVMGGLVLLPDDRHVVYSDQDRVIVYDFLAAKVQTTAYVPKETVSRIVISPDGRRVVALSHNGTMVLWELTGPERGGAPGLTKVGESRPPDPRLRIWEMAFSRGGEVLYTADMHGRLVKRELPTLRVIESLNVSRSVPRAIETLPPGNRLVLAGSDSPRGAYLLFFDLDRDTAVLTDISRGSTINLASVPEKGQLYVATQQELRRIDPPRPEQYRPARDVLAGLVEQQPAGGSAPQAAASIPILRGVASDSTIDAIGVYQGTRGRDEVRVNTSSGARVAAPVTVSIGRTERPVILVLSSYEPVLWKIRASREARVRHIFMSGYYDSLIEGISGVEITKIAGAYAYDERGLPQLNERIRQYTGREIGRFQSAYSGREFFVGAVTPIARADPPAPEFRCVDASGRPTIERVPCAKLGLKAHDPATVPGTRRAVGAGAIGVPSPGERVIHCGGDTIICGPGDTVHCGKTVISC